MVKYIIRYFIKTMSYGLWCPKIDDFEIQVFLNIDYAGDKDDRKKYYWNFSTHGKLTYLME